VVPSGSVRGFAATVRYTHDAAVIEKNKDLDVQGRADVAVSTRTVEQAMKSLDEGRVEEAEASLQLAGKELAASPAAAAVGQTGDALREQRARLEKYSQMLRENKGEPKSAKKSIQFDNYRTQKQK
jgi:hypothetical protein